MHSIYTVRTMEEGSSIVFLLVLFENSRSRLFLGQCAVLVYCKAACMGEELDVGKCWDSSFGFFLSLCLRVI